MIARLVHYSGRVQGVGFRYTVRGLAEGLPVRGYVRNLPDGRVELWAEGDEADVQTLLDAITERMAGYIREQVVREESSQGIVGFTIRH